MVSFSAMLLMLLAFAIVAFPLARPAARLMTGSSAQQDALDDLERERDSAYGAIKELEFEYQLGNLSPEDYAGLRDQYAERAARALSRLDEAKDRAAAAALAEPPAAEAETEGTVQVEVLPAGVCPLCRQPVEPDDRFCGECGALLSRFCRACGAQADPDGKYCAVCGRALEDNS